MAGIPHPGYKAFIHETVGRREDVVGTESSVRRSVDLAMQALRRHAASPLWHDDGTIAATMLAIGEQAEDRLGQLLRIYLGRDVHEGRENAFRYPWPISTLGEAGDPTYDIGPHATWWRPHETELRERLRRNYGRRLALPGVLATQLELWSQVAHDGGLHAPSAARLLAEVQATVEHDVARAVVAIDPWADTLLLWQMTERPGSLRVARGMLFALAIRYGTIAGRDGGVVHGIRFPFHRVPLTSATAHLALGLWQFGLYPALLPRQLGFLRSTARDGAWADGSQPSDILTTLAAAETLVRLDPAFDPEPTRRFFAEHQEPEGWWRALDPEVPWLTASIVAWMHRTEQPFAERFRWPEVALWQRDYITELPTMAYFAGLADAIRDSGGALGSSSLEIAFCDLAGFGAFNTRHSQAAGDEALRLFGASLARTGQVVVRIGGDELVVMGRPSADGVLEPALNTFLDRWPDELAAAFPSATGVRPRVMLDRGPAGSLRELHGRLGMAIGELKAATPDVPDRGILVWR
jgi:GGDEF domain-containing protein